MDYRQFSNFPFFGGNQPQMPPYGPPSQFPSQPGFPFPGGGQGGFPGGSEGFPGGTGGFPGGPGGFPGGQPGFPPGQQPGFPGGAGFPPGQQPGFPGQPGFQPGQQPGGQQEAPPSPPPAFTPQQSQASLFAVDPGGIRRCLYRNTYIWLNNGRSFWYYPTFVGRTSVAGWRWRRRRGWVYFGIDLRQIQSFQCF